MADNDNKKIDKAISPIRNALSPYLNRFFLHRSRSPIMNASNPGNIRRNSFCLMG